MGGEGSSGAAMESQPLFAGSTTIPIVPVEHHKTGKAAMRKFCF
jgi:hypothetical protein